MFESAMISKYTLGNYQERVYAEGNARTAASSTCTFGLNWGEVVVTLFEFQRLCCRLVTRIDFDVAVNTILVCMYAGMFDAMLSVWFSNIDY